MRWLVRLAVGCALASACSSFDSESTDAPPPVTTTDAGDASDATSTPTDSATPDADWVDAGDDGCVPFEFGSTFDDASALAVWTTVLAAEQPDAATVVVTGTLPDGQAPFSAPAALLASGHVPDGAAYGLRAFVSQGLMFVPSSIHVKYKLAVPSTSPYAEVGCVLLFTDGDAGAARIDTYMSDGFLYTRRSDADGSDTPHTKIGAQPTDWIGIDILATVDRDAGVVSGTVNGSIALPQAGLPPGVKEAFVQCGIGYADFGGPSPSGPDLVEVAVDDLEVRGCK